MTITAEAVSKPVPKRKFVGSFDPTMLMDMGEMEKRYRDTFLFYRPNQEASWLLTQVQNITPDTVSLFHPSYGEIILNRVSNGELEIKWPETGTFNYENYFLYIRRIPERQFKRAPCHKNVVIYPVLATLIGAYRSTMSIEFNTLEAAFQERTHLHLEDAIGILSRNDGMAGRILTSEFALSLHVAKESFILWYHCTPIAEVLEKQRKVIVKYKPLLQEVQDFIRDMEQNSWQVI